MKQIDTSSDVYEVYGYEYPYASAAVAFFIFGERDDNIIDKAFRGVYGRETEVEQSSVSEFMLGYEYSWQDNMEDIEDFIKNAPTKSGEVLMYYY